LLAGATEACVLAPGAVGVVVQVLVAVLMFLWIFLGCDVPAMCCGGHYLCVLPGGMNFDNTS
jgi:hypothetical protein